VEEGTRQRRVPTDLLEHAQLAAEAARAQQTAVDADDARNRAEIEVTRKRAEVAALVSQIQALTSTVDRLSRAVDEVAGFKRDAITLLGNQSANDRLSRDEAHQEIALLRADIEKKTAEITGMDSLRERLEHDMEHLRKEVQRLQNRGLLRR
jgi:chromosome segregation ATPase